MNNLSITMYINFVSPLEIINIPCTQGDKIYICTYLREHDKNLLKIFLICCLSHQSHRLKLRTLYPAI